MYRGGSEAIPERDKRWVHRRGGEAPAGAGEGQGPGAGGELRGAVQQQHEAPPAVPGDQGQVAD